MKLTKDQVKKVAKLANLPISDKEEAIYSKQMSDILGYIEQLNLVDTAKIEPTFNITGRVNVGRDDMIAESLTSDEVLQNSPVKKDGFFVTKGVFEGD